MTKNEKHVAMLRVVAATILAFFAGAVSVWAGPADDAVLQQAAMKLDVVAVKAALQRGANPNTPSATPRPMTPLFLLSMGMGFSEDPNANAKAVEIANVLFSSGARLGSADRGILFFPISHGNLQWVSLLLDRGASPTAKTEGYTPAELAIKYGQKEIYDHLVSRGAIPVKREAAAQVAFVGAVATADIATMEKMLTSGAHVDDPGPNGMTALISALRWPAYRRKEAEIIWWLLDKGADPNVTGESGFTGIDGIPLHVFVAMSRYPSRGMDSFPEAGLLVEETLTRLLKAGAKVSGMDEQGRTPLHVAAKFDNARAAETLIRAGARLMAKDAQGKTPLDYAESASMIGLLKKHGATER